MTKRWSSTRSLDGQTKREASKSSRRKEEVATLEHLRELSAAPPDAGFDNVADLLDWLNKEDKK